VYSLLNQSFEKRVLISSLISTPVDTAAFLFTADLLKVYGDTYFFNAWSLFLATATKFLSAYIVYLLLKWHRTHKKS
jgi:uncharacterized PurR-regulated membrane protein YhhQ (DUF165 family)